jgi:hypothetical protein
LNPISCGKNPENYLDLVKMLLPRASELVKDFEDIATNCGMGKEWEGHQQSTPSQNPDINLRRSLAFSATPTSNYANATGTSVADPNIIPSVFASSFPNPPSAHPPNGGAPLNNTLDFQDDGRQDDVENLLNPSEVNIAPHRRKKTPKQMLCALTEHQRIGLTWLLEQENDRKKKGGLLAGMPPILFSIRLT